MNKPTNTLELEKAKAHIIAEIVKYEPRAIVSQSIIKKNTGNITVISMDAGEEIAERVYPYDLFIQIIDGTASLLIKGQVHLLQIGEGIIIPAHASHRFQAKKPFKMLSTMIKSGYED